MPRQMALRTPPSGTGVYLLVTSLQYVVLLFYQIRAVYKNTDAVHSLPLRTVSGYGYRVVCVEETGVQLERHRQQHLTNVKTWFRLLLPYILPFASSHPPGHPRPVHPRPYLSRHHTHTTRRPTPDTEVCSRPPTAHSAQRPAAHTTSAAQMRCTCDLLCTGHGHGLSVTLKPTAAPTKYRARTSDHPMSTPWPQRRAAASAALTRPLASRPLPRGRAS